ncbi:MAG TPA: hypothetical protein VJ276_03385 [Thermoanaerobaculia bacterium]|nr:hypothetical protein [Thermoanaerobaculia bacterium]
MSRVELQPESQPRREQPEPPHRRQVDRREAQPRKPSKAEGEEEDVEEALKRK